MRQRERGRQAETERGRGRDREKEPKHLIFQDSNREETDRQIADRQTENSNSKI